MTSTLLPTSKCIWILVRILFSCRRSYSVSCHDKKLKTPITTDHLAQVKRDCFQNNISNRRLDFKYWRHEDAIKSLEERFNRLIDLLSLTSLKLPKVGTNFCCLIVDSKNVCDKSLLFRSGKIFERWFCLYILIVCNLPSLEANHFEGERWVNDDIGPSIRKIDSVCLIWKNCIVYVEKRMNESKFMSQFAVCCQL